MNLIFMGPPGAGKGTQAKVLSREFDIPHISTGDMLRNAVNKNTALGNEAKEYMVRGELVPDRLVIAIVKETLKGDSVAKGFILDGFPRTLEQARMLDKTLSEIGKGLDMALFFKTSLEKSVFRLSGRRVCKKCNANFHETNIPPKKKGVCDHCGGELHQRKDDRKATVKKRWSIYTKETAPVNGYYLKKGVLKEVPGDLDVGPLKEVLMALFQKNALI